MPMSGDVGGLSFRVDPKRGEMNYPIAMSGAGLTEQEPALLSSYNCNGNSV